MDWNSYLTGMISPVLISFDAAATRVGVSKLSRPIWSPVNIGWYQVASTSYIVIISPNPSCLFRSSGYLRKFLSCGELGTVRIPWDSGGGLVHCQEVLNLGQALVGSAFLIGHGTDSQGLNYSMELLPRVRFGDPQ